MLNATMKAARVHEYGGPEQIVFEDAPRPNAGPGQVLVRLKAAGVNPADWKMRAGYFKQFVPLEFPWIPGIEGAGVVEAIGAGVTRVKPGQEVYGPFNSSYAEYTAVPEAEVYRKPAPLSIEEAAAVPVGALTAWQAVIEEAEVQPGQRVLVHGGAGGVGLFAVQLAHWKGAHAIATASAANAEFIKSLGAEKVINYQTHQFEDELKDLDAVIDTVGGELIARSMHVIRPGGKFVTVAGMVDPEMGSARDILATSARRADTSKLSEISELLASKKIVPLVGQVFPLAKARAAQEMSQTGHGRGRILLTI